MFFNFILQVSEVFEYVNFCSTFYVSLVFKYLLLKFEINMAKLNVRIDRSKIVAL